MTFKMIIMTIGINFEVATVSGLKLIQYFVMASCQSISNSGVEIKSLKEMARVVPLFLLKGDLRFKSIF